MTRSHLLRCTKYEGEVFFPFLSSCIHEPLRGAFFYSAITPRVWVLACLRHLGLDVIFCFQQRAQDASGYAVSIGSARLLSFFYMTDFFLNVNMHFLSFVATAHNTKPQQVSQIRDFCG